MVFALEIEFRERPGISSVIRLNPSSFKLQNWNVFNYYLYIISGDEEDAKKVQKLLMSDEKYKTMVGMARVPRYLARADGTFGEFGFSPETNMVVTERDAND